MSTKKGILVAWLEAVFGPSWRTGLAGFLVIVATGASIVTPESRVARIASEAATLIAGGGLLLTRDNRVSSERAGAR